MASLTLGVGDTFPDGTTVGAYPASAWSGRFASGTPLGTATESQAVSSATVTFSALLPDTEYYAAGSVSGTYRYLYFRTPATLSGIELGHAEITADATRASTTYADVAGLSTTVTVGARPIAVYFSCAAASNNTANAGVGVKILEDGTAIGFAQTFFTAANVVPMHRRLRRAPSPGDHTYKVQLAAIFAGTATLKADANTAYGPCAISVVEI